MRLSRKVAAYTSFVLLAACSGGGSGGQPAGAPNAGGAGASASGAALVPAPAQAQAAPQSVGGIWHGISTDNQSLTFFVAEDGVLRVMESPSALAGPGLGAGAVIVAGDGRIAGAYGAKRLPAPQSFETHAETCDFTGTLRERASLSLEIECIEDGGTGRTVELTMGYNPDHAIEASLEAIAGNYTLAFRQQTNVLTIGADGVVFGVYDNGFACTVNGLVTVVDPRFNLYRFEWRLSGCKAPLTRYEGAVLTGLATRTPRGTTAGSLLLMLTGIVDAALDAVSVLYEPA